MIKYFLALFALLLLSEQPVSARQIENVDTAFQKARELAFDGQREEARELARQILEVSPGYHDVRILIARTYSWDGMYGDARRELQQVLDASPRYKDAHMARIDNEVWAERPRAAYDAALHAAGLFPADTDILFKLAYAQIRVEREPEALQTLERLEQLNPTGSELRELRAALEQSRRDYRFAASTTHDRFDQVFNPWSSGSLQLGRFTSAGTVIGRLNMAHRYDDTGIQPEIDFYPSIADGWYGYLNAGYSPHSIFPDFRLGAELHRILPWRMEVSAGFRYMNFPGGSVALYTGSLIRYEGNWMFSLRPFLTPGDAGLSRSFQLMGRRYYSGAENYLSLRAGFGFSPEVRTFQDVPGDNFDLRSRYIGIDRQFIIREYLYFYLSADLTWQELAFAPDDYLRRYTFSTGVIYRF